MVIRFQIVTSLTMVHRNIFLWCTNMENVDDLVLISPSAKSIIWNNYWSEQAIKRGIWGLLYDRRKTKQVFVCTGSHQQTQHGRISKALNIQKYKMLIWLAICASVFVILFVMLSSFPRHLLKVKLWHVIPLPSPNYCLFKSGIPLTYTN